MPDDVRAQLFRPAARLDADHAFAAFRSVHGHRADALARGGRPEDYVNLSLYFEARTFLHGLLVVEDRLSMAHGLETRLPFLDDDLVDFALRMPVRHKLAHLGAAERLDENAPGRKHERYFSRNQDGKRVLRQVLGQFVPESVSAARKQGFSAPDGSWFRGESVDYIRRLLLSPDARLYQWLEPAAVQGLLEQHFSGAVNRRLFVWSCLCFEWWLRTFDPSGPG
jgi:asparagine synthase (glutamine-hydrolysing)